MDSLIAKYYPEAAPDGRMLFYSYEPVRYDRITLGPSAFHAAMGAWCRGVEGERPLALYVHVPYCPQICLYCTCNTTACADPAVVQAYAVLLLREIDRFEVDQKIQRDHPRFLSLHLGGGSPSSLPDETLARILARLRALPGAEGVEEVAMEVDPRAVDAARSRRLQAMGVTRLSLGCRI